MKILLDHQIFSLQKYGGISRYFGNIYHQFKHDEDIQIKLGVLSSKNHYINDYPFPIPEFISKLVFKKSGKLYKWNKRYTNLLIEQNNFDVYHATYYDQTELHKIKKPVVITVHDLIHEMMPEYFHPKDRDAENKKKWIDRADKIIAISESTKSDLINIYNVDEKKIAVVYHAYYDEKSDSSDLVNNKMTSNEYLLFVGQRGGYKNFNRFINAVTPILKKRKSMEIICAGGGPFESSEIQIINRFGISQRVQQKSVTNQELMSLYQKASLFIFPSLYEGFGFPIIEAFANNCPVACSNISVFREVAENAALYFDPYSVNEMTSVIDSALDDGLLNNDLKNKGLSQLKRYSSEKFTSATKYIYQSLKS